MTTHVMFSAATPERPVVQCPEFAQASQTSTIEKDGTVQKCLVPLSHPKCTPQNLTALLSARRNVRLFSLLKKSTATPTEHSTANSVHHSDLAHTHIRCLERDQIGGEIVIGQ